MKKAIVALLLACVVIVPVSPSWAATYYVDFVGGSDMNNGTSTSTPFRRSPGDANATDVPASTALFPGDTVLFKGGVVYQGRINTNWSGTQANRITYDGNSAGTFGTGRAILDGNNMAQTIAFDVTADSNITIKNFEVRNYRSTGVQILNASQVTLQNGYIHDISDWDLSECSGSGCNLNYVHSLGAGIRIIGTSNNVVVDSVEVTKTGHAGIIIQDSVDDIEVKNCDFHDFIHWTIDIAPAPGTTISNILIHDNKIRNIYHYSGSFWTSTGDGKANPGVGEAPHEDGIFVRNPSVGTLTNIRIYNNAFYSEVNFTDHGGTSTIFVSEPRQTGGIHDTIHIYNNTFQNCYMYYAVTLAYFYTNGGGRIFVYENSWHMQNNSALYVTQGAAGSPARIEVRNNIFSLTNGEAMNLSNTATANLVTSNFNVFKRGTGPISQLVVGPGTYSNLSDWQNSGFGEDANSIQVTDLQYVDPRPATQSSLSNLRLLAGSPAIDRGTALGAAFAVDKDGTPRPQGTQWDPGAYEYGGGAPAPPANLRMTSQ